MDMNLKIQELVAESPVPQTSIMVSVEFGQRLSNGNCGHVGICNIGDATLPGDAPIPRHRRCRQATAQISVGNDGHPIFFFSRDQMLSCTQRAFFSGSNFSIPAPFELPIQWQIELPQLQSPILASGQYKIEKYAAGFLIRF